MAAAAKVDAKSATVVAAAAAVTATGDAKSVATAADSKKEVLTGLKKDMDELLSSLYKMSEVYTGDVKVKMSEMKAIVDKVVRLADDAEKDTAKLASEGISVARLWFWKGRAHDVFGHYDKEAEKWLSKAVKSEPDMIEAWNALGNCYWKKKDLAQAHNCLKSALDKKKNKESLCNLSMVLRNMDSKDPAARQKNINDSVTRAREAIGMDGKDGKCWYVLANALLTQFFMTAGSTLETLASALKAYKQAEVSEVNCAATNPDLHFNRANVYKFYEDYQEAIDGYKKSASLDPSLPAAEEIDTITRFVIKLSKLVSSRGGLKAKKLSSVVASLVTSEPTLTVEKVERKRLTINKLKTGVNQLTAVCTKVIAPISRDSDTPCSFLIADADSTVCVISLYNVTSDVINGIRAGDPLICFEPNLKEIALKPPAAGTVLTEANASSLETAAYKCIHITNPFNILVNGRRLNSTAMAQPRLKTDLL